MYKFIFELLTSPLGLPVHWLIEYIFLAIIGVISFNIGWEISPGGKLGSIIHWSIRSIVFFVLWAIIYGICYLVQLLIKHYIVVICFILIILMVLFFIFFKKRKGNTAVNTNKEVINLNNDKENDYE